MDIDDIFELLRDVEQFVNETPEGVPLSIQGGRGIAMHRKVESLNVVFSVHVGQRGGLVEQIIAVDTSKPIIADRFRGIHQEHLPRGYFVQEIREHMKRGSSFQMAATAELEKISLAISQNDVSWRGRIRCLGLDDSARYSLRWNQMVEGGRPGSKR